MYFIKLGQKICDPTAKKLSRRGVRISSARDLLGARNELTGCNMLTLYWMVVHAGVESNEKAKLTKTSFVGLEPFCGLRASAVPADL